MGSGRYNFRKEEIVEKNEINENSGHGGNGYFQWAIKVLKRAIENQADKDHMGFKDEYLGFWH